MGSYFIRIEDAPDLRRKILESSKASIHILKGYQQLLIIRNQKLSHMNHLRSELKQLSVLINRAEALMPLLTERELEELNPKPVPAQRAPEGKWVKKGNRKVFIAPPKKTVVTEVAAPMPDLEPAPKREEQPKKMTELERLEQALSSIEDKLGTM